MAAITVHRYLHLRQPDRWCRGCGRTKAECRHWKKAQPQDHRRVSADLPRRLSKLAQAAGS